jgi:hypothetical protein
MNCFFEPTFDFKHFFSKIFKASSSKMNPMGKLPTQHQLDLNLLVKARNQVREEILRKVLGKIHRTLRNATSPIL